MGLKITYTMNPTSTGEQGLCLIRERLRLAIFQHMLDSLCADLQVIRPHSLSRFDASAAGATPYHHTIL